VRADLRAVADLHAPQQRGARPDAHTGADDDRVRAQALQPHGLLDVLEVMVEVDDDDLVGKHGARADLDALLRADHAAIAEHGAGADADGGPGRHVEAAPVAEDRAVADRHRPVEDEPAAEHDRDTDVDPGAPPGPERAHAVTPPERARQRGRRRDGVGRRNESMGGGWHRRPS
jgi:hypothetical protein